MRLDTLLFLLVLCDDKAAAVQKSYANAEKRLLAGKLQFARIRILERRMTTQRLLGRSHDTQAATLHAGNPPVAKDGSKMVEGEAVLGAFKYSFAARVRRHMATAQTLFKRTV